VGRGFSDYFFETGFINGKCKIGAVPNIDACLIDGNTNMRGIKGDATYDGNDLSNGENQIE